MSKVLMVDKRTLGIGYLAATGLTLTIILLIRLFSIETLASQSGLETLTGLLLSTSLAYAGFWVGHTELEDKRVWHITQWSAAGLAVVVLISIMLLVLTQVSRGLAESASILVTNVAAGGVAGVLVGTVTEFRDEQRRTAELNRRNQVLNRVLRHNIRNETNVILGYAANLAEELQGDPAENAQVIRGKAENVAQLGKKARQIERALDTKRERFPVDVGEIAADAIEAVRTEHPNARIDSTIPDSAWVNADDMLSFVIRELLENAVIHSDEGVEIEVVVEVGDESISIAISDDGPGIPHQEREVLETDQETPLLHGSGLGLRAIKWLIEHYGGTLEFANRTSQGTTVNIDLQSCDPPKATSGDARLTELLVPQARGSANDGTDPGNLH